jgi:PAS domain S-box-containing protein
MSKLRPRIVSADLAVIRFLYIVILAIGIGGLIGHLLQVEFLTSFLDTGNSLKFNAAIGIILCGLNLIFLRQEKFRNLTYIFTSLIFLNGALVYFQNFSGFSLGIDEFFLKDFNNAGIPPGRMSTPLATTFILTAFAFLGRIKKNTLLIEIPSYFLLIAYFLLIYNYVFEVIHFGGNGEFTKPSINAMLAMLCIQVSNILGSKKGFLAPFLANTEVAKKGLFKLIAVVMYVILLVIAVYQAEKRFDFSVAQSLTLVGVCSVIFFGFVLRRITRHANEAELEKTKLTSIIEASESIVSTCDEQGNIHYANCYGRKKLEIPADDPINKYHIADLMEGDCFENIMQNIIPIVLNKGFWSGETTLRTLSGKMIPVYQMILVHNKKDGSVDYFSTIAQDISEIKEKEKELEEKSVMLRDLAVHLQNVREEERLQIANMIHEELAQDMAVIKMQLHLVMEGLYGNPMLHQRSLQELSEYFDAIFKDIRRITSDLRPQLLFDMGLIEAIEQYVDEFRETNPISVVMDLELEHVVVSHQKSLAIFRVVQESLTNIVKHAAASHVYIHISQQEDPRIIKISIIDDGKGFDLKEKKEKRSFGLVGMQERVLSMGGILRIKTSPGEGTSIRIKVPLEENLHWQESRKQWMKLG